MLYPDFDELVSYKKLKIGGQRPRLSQSLVVGGCRSLFRGRGLEFDSVRKYVPGDDIRNIDWRVTARTGSPHLKIFQEERQRTVFLCVDTHPGMRFGTRNTFKSVQAARIAALLGWQALADQNKCTGYLDGAFSSFSPFLKKLCETPGKECCSIFFNELLYTVPSGSLVYFISDFMHIAEEDALLSRLRRRCDIVFVSVNDPADAALFPVGLLEFQGFEKVLVNTDSIAGREAYALQWRENRLKLGALASRFRIPLIELSTESTIRDLLLLLGKKR